MFDRSPDPDAPDAPRLLDGVGVALGGLLVLGLVVAVLVAFVGDAGLAPLFVALLAGALLWPLRAVRSARALLLTGAVALAVWLVFVLEGVLLPFVLVFLLAYLVNPLVERLEARRYLSRTGSALIVTALVTGVGLGLAALLAPPLVGEVGTLVERGLTAMAALQEMLATSDVLARLDAAGVIDQEAVAAAVGALVEERLSGLGARLPRLLSTGMDVVGALLEVLVLWAVLPVLMFFMLKDYPAIARQVAEFFPTFGGERRYLFRAGQVVGSYLRGQFLVALIAALNVTIALALFGVPFAVLIGLLAGVLNLVPNLGALITGLVGAALALVFGTPLDALVVLGVLVAQNVLEQAVLIPKIMSTQLGLHPVLVLFSLFVFGTLFGLVGLLVAVPVTALAVTLYRARQHTLDLELAPEARLKRDLAARLAERE